MGTVLIKLVTPRDNMARGLLRADDADVSTLMSQHHHMEECTDVPEKRMIMAVRYSRAVEASTFSRCEH